ncbi:hypothetical protein Csp1_23440 [Corynebacterium provencense]|uniref:Uncharacterized protein n=1 Tax=Corynebacterium provencense TaxID=1737425 RepID=A0A2Z3YX14_9CORY|nr:YbjN domain-containing protein [Corynebacterium provencense]AWT27094.1 hypothetical protein Csp1_23440 [Corynebacterium provencense]
MFGFGRRKSTDARGSVPGPDASAVPDAPVAQPAPTESAEQVVPGPVEAPLAANALQLVAAGAGLTALCTGTTVWLHSGALGLGELDLVDIDLRVEVGGSSQEPLVHDAVMDWYGVLDGMDPLDVQRLVNGWNDRFVGPRVYSWRDGQGHLRIRGEIVMTWWRGHTVAQVDDFLRVVVSAALNLSEWLEEQWPSVDRLTPETVPPENGVALTGDDRGLEETERLAAQFVTPGNPFGLLKAETAPVTADRIADLFAARSGQRSQVSDDGVLRIRWGEPAVDIAVHDAVLTISSGAEVMVADPEQIPDSLLEVTWKWSTNRAGAVAVVHREQNGPTFLVYALHQFVGMGMSDGQLAMTASRTCELVADCMLELAGEITGGR